MKKQATILIVDDEKNTREGLSRALGSHYRVLLAENGQNALEVLSKESIDIVLSDVRMPGIDGMMLIEKIGAKTPAPICILLTAYGTIETAVEAMKRGAYDFLTKPVNLDELELVLKRALHSRDIEVENRDLHEQLDRKYGLENIVGNAPKMQEVFEMIRQVAASKATVLIQGESGTGKELVAQAIHRLSPRSRGPFVAVHCAALTSTLLESELFGHEKGAFTGAAERRRGRFERADGGTLFLDEIGEIDQNVQVKILRVLEQRSFERVGGQQTVEVDVRLIAATNRDLKQMVAAGTFREDLYYRLEVVLIHVPALRERREDIPFLAGHFLSELTKENNKSIEGFTPEAMELLASYAWPGNVRELRNVIERMVVMSHGNKITVREIPTSIKEAVSLQGGAKQESAYSLEEAEKKMIVEALQASGGVRKAAAARLGISMRTLHRKLNEYGLRGTV